MSYFLVCLIIFDYVLVIVLGKLFERKILDLGQRYLSLVSFFFFSPAKQREILLVHDHLNQP